MSNISDYEDVRIELATKTHNLTSVLMNPRNSMYEEIMDDIWDDFTDVSSHSSTVSSTHGSFSYDNLHNLSLSGHGNITNKSMNGKSSSGDGIDESMSYLREGYNKYLALNKRTTSDNGNGNRGLAFQASNKDPKDKERERAMEAEKNAASASCFRQVPEMFFHSDFNLTKTKMFEQQQPQKGSSNTDSNSSVDNSDFSNTAVAINTSKTDTDTDTVTVTGTGNNQIKKLNEYLDLVEYALLQQIWSRSSDIFSALDDIKGQQDHVNDAIIKLNMLHKHLRNVDEQITSSAVHIPLINRRRNFYILKQKTSSKR